MTIRNRVFKYDTADDAWYSLHELRVISIGLFYRFTSSIRIADLDASDIERLLQHDSAN